MDLPTFLPPLMSSSTSNPTTNNPPPSISVPTPTLLPILSDLPTLLTRATIISVSSTPTSTITLTPTPTPTPIINIVETVSSISSILSIPATISTPPTSVFVPLVSAASSPLLFVSSPTLTPSSNTFSRNLEPSAIVRRLTPKSTWASGMKLWGLDIMDGVLNDAYVTEHTGQGPVHLYYLGPGMIGNHPEFKTNQINSLYSALGLREGSSFSLDCNGQGTAVGGILVSNTMGVATDAQVHVLRVQDCDGIDTLSLDKAKHVIDALTFLQSQIQRPAVIQLSFLPNLGKDITEINTLKTLLGYFVNTLGVPVVVPAGDNASNKCVTNGLLDKLQGLISVCAHDENFNAIASSNFGDCCTVYAPGANIWVRIVQ
ncbi:hypothetical protein HMI54_010944 [Coelomomyces lativittatus]|nr:hypothetical protein HMI54_010944 [Coelomomyces lativittatus]